MIKIAQSLMILGVIANASAAMAQSPAWDSSGNSQLNGTYNFREVYYQVGDAAGDLSGGTALYGNIVFDGKGNYSVGNATLLTYSQGAGSTKTYSATGTYSISASGYGFLSGIYCPVSAGCGTNTLYVLVSSGLVVGSSPDTKLNDVFIGAPVAATAQTNASFQGAWTLAGYVPAISASAGLSADVFFPLAPDGNGNLGTVSMKGYIGSNNVTQPGTQTVQTAAGVTYSFSSGVATVKFPAVAPGTAFFSGNETLYFSPDSTFFFGGSPSFPDLVVGVRNPATAASQTLSGIYYTAGIDENEHFLGAGSTDFYTYYGAFNASGGNLLEVDRMEDPFSPGPISSSYSALYPATISGGTYNNGGLTQYAFSASGAVRVSAGIGPYLGLGVGLQAPTLTGSGVYLNPMGVANAASFAPFVGGISPGEAIVLYGSGMAASSSNAQTLPLPTTLNNVQVTINNVAAPLYYVTPGQIALIVPYGTTGPVAQIQVINNGVTSNAVTQFVRQTSPGVFTLPSGGIGPGAIEHANGTLVSESSPAVPGETVVVYMGGLGAVTPPVADGAAVPLSPVSNANSSFVAFFGWAPTNASFAGLVPTLAGLYQVNAQVPLDAPSGDQIFELDGPDSATAQAIIPIAGNSTPAASLPAGKLRPRGYAGGR